VRRREGGREGEVIPRVWENTVNRSWVSFWRAFFVNTLVNTWRPLSAAAEVVTEE